MPRPITDYDAKIEYSRSLTERFKAEFQDVTHQLLDGDIYLSTWQIDIREQLRSSYALQLITAAGGDVANVDPNDWLRLGSKLQSQYRYLEDFANEIKAGNLSDEMILARIGMYAEASKDAFWTQLKKDYDLPAMPGDGSTECLTNCGCEWTEDNRWVLGKSDNCQTCLERAAKWNPYEPGVE